MKRAMLAAVAAVAIGIGGTVSPQAHAGPVLAGVLIACILGGAIAHPGKSPEQVLREARE